jgi:hypothetical protein
MITRNQGYRLSKGKEEASQELFTEWANTFGVNASKIEGYDNNRLKGDYLLDTGGSLELKSQNIGAYNQNFIEIGEITNNPIHAEGYDKLSEIFAPYGIDDLSKVNVSNREKTVVKFGMPEFFNVGFTPVANGANIMYINNNTSLIYFYTAAKFLHLVADAIQRKGFSRGLGRANMDSIAVFIPNSEISWIKEKGEYVYTGNPSYEHAVMELFK